MPEAWEADGWHSTKDYRPGKDFAGFHAQGVVHSGLRHCAGRQFSKLPVLAVPQVSQFSARARDGPAACRARVFGGQVWRESLKGKKTIAGVCVLRDFARRSAQHASCGTTGSGPSPRN